MTNHADITNLLKSFSGQARILTIPRAYIDMLQGDHLAALLLSQAVFLSDRAADDDGWFAKSYADWTAELGLSERQIRRVVDLLRPFGLETKLRRSSGHDMAATLHYRVDMNTLTNAVLRFCRSRSDETSERGSDETSERSYIEEKKEREDAREDTEGNTPTAPLQNSRYTPPAMRVLQNDTLAHANGYQLIQAFADFTGLIAETIYSSYQAKQEAAALAKNKVTPEDVKAFMTELKRTQPERYNGYRFHYMAEDLPMWKRNAAAAPVKTAAGSFWGRDLTDGE
jgi:hypothetical protein